MVKNTQTIRWLWQTNCFTVFDHFVGLALKGLFQRNLPLKCPKMFTLNFGFPILSVFNALGSQLIFNFFS